MKQKLKTLLPVLALLLGMGLWPALATAAGATISLTASKSVVSSGGSVVIAVYVNPAGTPINAAEADLTYSASQLQYVGISYSGSALSINAPTNGGGSGAVTIAEGTTSPVSGSALLATVTFRALASSGSTTIGVAGSSSLVSASDSSAVPYSGQGVSFKFGTVTASPTAAATPAAPAAPKDTTPPVISAIKVKDLSPYSATVIWTTNEPADSDVDFGLDATYGLSNSSTTLVTAHSVVLSSAFLTPETLFHYHVKSADASGNVAASPDQTLNLPGVPVTIIVRGADGKQQADVSVTLDSATGTTDAHGSVTLPSGLGNKKITTSYQGVTIQKPITITKSAKPLPPYQLDLSKQPLNHWMVTSVGLLVVVLVLLGIDAVLFGSHFFARFTGLKFMPESLLHPHFGSAKDPTIAEAQAAAEHAQSPDLTVHESVNGVTAHERPVGAALQAIDTLPPFGLRPTTGLTADITSPKRITVSEELPAESSPSATLAAQLKKPKTRKPARKTGKTSKPRT